MSWIVTILAGALIGWIASMIMKTNAQMGAIANILAGIIGAFVGSLIAPLLGFRPRGAEFNIPALLFGVLGACIVIGIYKAVTGASNRVA
jgi:uncharacterized membrane protein YeaQ/YmgE (transglycosylase-associated protein family)